MLAPNALKLLLPQSNSQVRAKAITTVSIDKDLRFYLETSPIKFEDLERQLQLKLMNDDDPTVSLHVDKSVPMEEVVKVMNVAKNNKYKLILATAPES
jgi:biopolymer transport protein ExbD